MIYLEKYEKVLATVAAVIALITIFTLPNTWFRIGYSCLIIAILVIVMGIMRSFSTINQAYRTLEYNTLTNSKLTDVLIDIIIVDHQLVDLLDGYEISILTNSDKIIQDIREKVHDELLPDCHLTDERVTIMTNCVLSRLMIKRNSMNPNILFTKLDPYKWQE